MWMQNNYSILWGVVINVYSLDRTLSSLFNIQSHFTHFEVKKFTLGDWLWGCQWAGVKAGGKVKETSSLCQTLEPHIPHTTEPMEMLHSRVTDGTLPCCSRVLHPTSDTETAFGVLEPPVPAWFSIASSCCQRYSSETRKKMQFLPLSHYLEPPRACTIRVFWETMWQSG